MAAPPFAEGAATRTCASAGISNPPSGPVAVRSTGVCSPPPESGPPSDFRRPITRS
ncbi:hypothetical protein GCM10020229_79980 [Kitasatospora albolonga]